MSTDGQYVWGCNGAHKVFKCSTAQPGGWQDVPGKLVFVSAGQSAVVGANYSLEVYRCAADGKWAKLPGQLGLIATDATGANVSREAVCGVRCF